MKRCSPLQALPAAGLLSTVPRAASAQSAQAGWRTFETFTRLEITQPMGAVYEWVVENTERNPKARGCGVGDIKAMLERKALNGKCADLNALFAGLVRAAGVPARDVYGIRVADSARGDKSLGKAGEITRAQHCRAEFYAQEIGWIPVHPADVRKVILEEKPNLTLADEVVEEARTMLWGGWGSNWMGYHYAHDVRLPGSTRAPVPFLMYPQAENAQGRGDALDAENFRYRITSRKHWPRSAFALAAKEKKGAPRRPLFDVRALFSRSKSTPTPPPT